VGALRDLARAGIGVTDAMALTAADGLNRQELLARSSILVRSTTRAVDAILTGSSALAAFLTTTGQPGSRSGRTDRLPGRASSPTCRMPLRSRCPIGYRAKCADATSRWQVHGVIVMPNERVDPDATALQRARLAGRGSGDGGMSDG